MPSPPASGRRRPARSSGASGAWAVSRETVPGAWSRRSIRPVAPSARARAQAPGTPERNRRPAQRPAGSSNQDSRSPAAWCGVPSCRRLPGRSATPRWARAWQAARVPACDGTDVTNAGQACELIRPPAALMRSGPAPTPGTWQKRCAQDLPGTRTRPPSSPSRSFPCAGLLRLSPGSRRRQTAARPDR